MIFIYILAGIGAIVLLCLLLIFGLVLYLKIDEWNENRPKTVEKRTKRQEEEWKKFQEEWFWLVERRQKLKKKKLAKTENMED